MARNSISDARQIILVIEGDPQLAARSCQTLARVGYEAFAASSTGEARRIVDAHQVDLVILDFRLSNVFYELEDRGRNAAAQAIPLIVVTASSAEAAVAKAQHANAHDFIRRLADLCEFLPNAVEQVLAQVAMQHRAHTAEACFMAFMEHSPAAAYVKDEQGRTLFSNLAFDDIFGRPSGMASASPPGLSQTELNAAKLGREVLTQESVQSTNGRLRHLLSVTFPIHDPSQRNLIGGLAIDETDRRNAEDSLREKEEQLRQSQKLEAMGTLAGGIAHEFNNLLQAIKGYTGFAMEGLSPDDQRYQDLQQSAAATDRAAGLTRQLLRFGRRDSLRLSTCGVNEIVGDLVAMLKPLFPASIELQSSLDPSNGSIHADSDQLHQVLLNICLNARDAMPAGGVLTLETGFVVSNTDTTDRHGGLAPGEYATVTVRDTGQGMTAEVRRRIFEPFFTTKEVNQGTGLGLSVAHSIVQRHGGAIQVASVPGRGTQLTVFLPTRQDSEPTPTDDADFDSSFGQQEKILIADDEPLVREWIARTLRSAGYETVVATDGEDAVAQFRRHADDLALALLDLAMPRLGGREAHAQMALINPNVPVVYCTGYAPDEMLNGTPVDTAPPLLHKPVSPAQLLNLVRQTLDKAAELCLTTE